MEVLLIASCVTSLLRSSYKLASEFSSKTVQPLEQKRDFSKFLNTDDEFFIRGTTILVNRQRQRQTIPLKIKEIKVYDGDNLEIIDKPVITESKPGEDAFYKLEYPTFKEVRKIEIIPEVGCESALVGATIEFLNSAGSIKWFDNILEEMPKYEFDIFLGENYPTGRIYKGQCGGLGEGIVLTSTNSTRCFSNCNSISRKIEDYFYCKDDEDRSDCSPELEDVQKYSSDVTEAILDNMDPTHKEYCEFKPENSCKFFKTNKTLIASTTLDCSSNAYCYDNY